MKSDRRIAGLLLVGTMFGVGCERQAATEARASAEKPASIAVVRAERRALSRSMELAAEFRAYQEVDVHAKVAGFLKNIAVDMGDRVQAGQVIATLEVPEFAEEFLEASAKEKRSELDVVRARSEVNRAQATFDITKISLGRIEGAAKARPQMIAQQEIDTIAARFHEAEAQLATSKAALAALEQQVHVSSASSARVKTMIGYLRIVAPFSGVVTKRYADTGAMIQAGTASQSQALPVVRIAQVDRLRLNLPVPESFVSRIRVGNPVEVRVDSLQRVFQGRVARFAGELKASTRTMDTEVDIDNGGGLIRPGMYGYASLALESRPDALAVPVQAVSRGLTTSVMVVNTKGRIEDRSVKIGLETPNYSEVLSGIQEGDLVVTGSHAGLKAGTPVSPKIVAVSEVQGGH
ncbi:MAG: efflux RND transporter periplasmic adaptor subunit [Acidobacteriota bacterium]